MIEQIKPYLHAIEDIPPAYRGWIAERNGVVGDAIINDITARSSGSRLNRSGIFLIATRALTRKELAAHEVGEDFYGTAVSTLTHVDKGILHTPVERLTKEPPIHYSSVVHLAEEAQASKLVLPGFTVFGPDDLLQGYHSLGNGHNVRVKMPGHSDGNGQERLTCTKDVERLLGTLDGSLFQDGIVLEPQLRDPKTVSVGFAKIGNDLFSFVAHQKDQTIPSNTGCETTRYAGADVVVVNGHMEELLRLQGLDRRTTAAIYTSLRFWDRYSDRIRPQARRLSFDYLVGCVETNDGKPGEILAGITDVTARPGGTDPAIIEAVKRFRTDPSAKAVKAEVCLRYYPSTEPTYGELYVHDPGKLDIKARVKSVSGEFQLR